MSHARQQCLARVTALVTNLPLAGDRVFQSRFYPFQQAELPGRFVRYAANAEIVEPGSELGAPRVQVRRLRVEVINVVDENADLDAALDDMCLEVEKALALPDADGPWNRITLLGTTIEFSVEGDVPCGVGTLQYEIEYVTEENAPDVAL